MKTIVAGLLSMVTLAAAGIARAGDAASPATAYDFAFISIDGQPMPLAQWRGKALLVVNTASFCGYTRQYAGLQDLWTKYEAQGLVVVGVPSNDFGGQEPKGEGEIKKFCRGAFGVTFPLTSKEVVTGSKAHPFYQWAAARAGRDGAPGWNFHKYLIGRDGRLVAPLPTRLEPQSAEVTGAIEKALAEPAPALVPRG